MSVEVKMPQLTQTMSEATIIRWLKNEGDPINAGEPLLEVMTDKAAVEIEAPAGGVLGRILVQGGDISVGTPIAIILAPGEAIPELIPKQQDSASMGESAGVQFLNRSKQEGQLISSRKRISPLAKRLAVELGVDLEKVTPTGPGGLITEADIRRARDSSQVSTQSPSDALTAQVETVQQAPSRATEIHGADSLAKEGEEIVPFQGVRRIIADRLAFSRRTAADVTTVAEVDMGEVAALREHIELTYTLRRAGGSARVRRIPHPELETPRR